MSDLTNPKFYLENMPVAYCVIKIVTDDKGNPIDFVFTYSNKAHAELEGVFEGAFIGKSFFKLFDNANEKLAPYYDTAFNGEEHVISEYNPNTDKHLLIHTYQLKKGFCGCVLMDITESRKAELRFDQEREKVNFLLEFTTDIIFEYDVSSKSLIYSMGGYRYRTTGRIDKCPQGLVDRKIILEKDAETLGNVIREMEAERETINFELQACLDESGEYKWYMVSCCKYIERYTEHACVVGCLRNIESFMQRQRMLQKDAMYDPMLREIYNVKTGRELVSNELKKDITDGWNIMFLMDLDDFKRINDAFGHQKGDEALVKFAEVIKRAFRKRDIVYRLGGDEFICFTRSADDPEQTIKNAMDRLYGKIDEINAELSEEGYNLQCSVGIFVTNKRVLYKDFYEMSDRALYKAKRDGKNRYSVIYDIKR